MCTVPEQHATGVGEQGGIGTIENRPDAPKVDEFALGERLGIVLVEMRQVGRENRRAMLDAKKDQFVRVCAQRDRPAQRR